MDRVHRGGPWTWGPCFVYVPLSESLSNSSIWKGSVLNDNERYTHQLARYRFHRPKFEATVSQAAAVLRCCNFLSYRFHSPDGKVLGQMTRGQKFG